MPNLTARQWEAFQYLEDAVTTELLFGGGAGGGKSWLGCAWLLASSLRLQGSRWMMGRTVLKTLKETTLVTFLDMCGKAQMVGGRDYIYNKQNSDITIGQSLILMKDLKYDPSDPNFDDLGSLELTGAMIEEAQQVVHKAKTIVKTRIRYKLTEWCYYCKRPGLNSGIPTKFNGRSVAIEWMCSGCSMASNGHRPKLLMTCNPGKNWVRTEFAKPFEKGELAEGRAFVRALVKDNPHIAPDYEEGLEKLVGMDRNRLLLGDFDYDADDTRLISDDAIANMFTNEHVAPGSVRFIVVDVAGQGRDRTVISLWYGLVLVHFTVMDKSSGPEVVAAIQHLAKMEGVVRTNIVVDADGIGGMGVCDYLPGCTRYHGGGSPVEVQGKQQNFRNLKAQCSYMLAEYMEGGEIYTADSRYSEQIEEELAYVKSWKADTDQKVQVMPKEEVVVHLRRSPDFGDVYVMRMVKELQGSPIASEQLRKKGQAVRRERIARQFRNSLGYK